MGHLLGRSRVTHPGSRPTARPPSGQRESFARGVSDARGARGGAPRPPGRRPRAGRRAPRGRPSRRRRRPSASLAPDGLLQVARRRGRGRPASPRAGPPRARRAGAEAAAPHRHHAVGERLQAGVHLGRRGRVAEPGGHRAEAVGRVEPVGVEGRRRQLLHPALELAPRQRDDRRSRWPTARAPPATRSRAGERSMLRPISASVLVGHLPAGHADRAALDPEQQLRVLVVGEAPDARALLRQPSRLVEPAAEERQGRAPQWHVPREGGQAQLGRRAARARRSPPSARRGRRARTGRRRAS